jgi:putative ABC transport system ATP-binding protein
MENIEVSLMIQDDDVPTERKKKIQMVLEHLGLSKRKEHNPTELSGGQQQRVAIARAMIRKPKYFLLDEPTGNVDTQNRDIIMKLIKKLNQTKNITTILITHDLKLAEMADTVYYLVDGEFVSKEEFERPLIANGSRN